jgi:hypothetical protein
VLKFAQQLSNFTLFKLSESSMSLRVMEASSQIIKALCWPCCGQNHSSYHHFSNVTSISDFFQQVLPYKDYISISEQYIFESTAATVQAQLQFVPTRFKKWGKNFQALL